MRQAWGITDLFDSGCVSSQDVFIAPVEVCGLDEPLVVRGVLVVDTGGCVRAAEPSTDRWTTTHTALELHARPDPSRATSGAQSERSSRTITLHILARWNKRYPRQSPARWLFRSRHFSSSRQTAIIAAGTTPEPSSVTTCYPPRRRHRE